MKGISQAIADPIEALDEYDRRPSVKALIAEHRAKIDKLKDAVKDHPLLDMENKHDDLWFLRFWLSHKKSKAAIAAINHTLEFREKHKLDEADLRSCPPQDSEWPVLKKHHETHQQALAFTQPNPKRGVIMYAKMTGIDQQKVLATCTQEDIIQVYIYWSEFSFQTLDYVTRTTGRLTKTIRLIDVGGLSMLAINHEYNKRESFAVSQMEDCYPQMLEKIYVVNGASWVQIPWRVLRPFMPKRVVSKMDFIAPGKNEKERIGLYSFVSQDDLPTAYGGSNTKPILGVPLVEKET